MPGRREFEHEYENDAEDLVKDLEFGIVLEYGGDQQPEDEEKPEESGAMEVDVEVKVEGDGEKNADPDEEEPQPPAVVESTDSMQLKLSLLDMYNERLDARIEAKAIVLERGLTDHKRVSEPLRWFSCSRLICVLDTTSRTQEIQGRSRVHQQTQAICSTSNR